MTAPINRCWSAPVISTIRSRKLLNDFWQSEEWKAIAALLPPPSGRALDMGAGRGISSYALARDGWQVTALEPDPSDLVGAGAIRALARDTGYTIDIVAEYSEKLPFADATFDVVNCRQVLHHARDLRQTCTEIFRVLKPGGVMIATREHVLTTRADLNMFLSATHAPQILWWRKRVHAR